MPVPVPTGYAFNRTRSSYLATELRVAGTHWSRLRGLMLSDRNSFGDGHGLWIVPSHGVHTFAMRFPIDVVYLDANKTVVYVKQNLQPWRVAAVRSQAESVLELPASTLEPTGTSVGDKIEIVFGKAAKEVAS
jgi:uncharacterized membrane protein (UPF0127 family)